MDMLLEEHNRLSQQSNLSKIADDVQSTLEILMQARERISSDPDSASITLAKLQDPIKKSFTKVNDDLKQIHSGLGKYTKALDKKFKDKLLPTEGYDALSSHPTLVNRAIAMHLLREGQFSVASTFITEATANPPRPTAQLKKGSFDSEVPFEDTLGVGPLDSEPLQQQFTNMYYILHQLKNERNLLPAIEWARKHSGTLEARGSNLEFDLVRLQFVWLFMGGRDHGHGMEDGPQKALEYAREEFNVFQGKYLPDIQQLACALAFQPNLEHSPYRRTFHNDGAWDEVANSFTREFCSLLGLSADSPLYVAATAGAIALPTLLKLQNIMKEKRTEWTTQNELPVEIPLPPAYQFHSIFVCPVSKEQTTDQNPPMMMPCGHVVAQESLMRLSKGSRFKCPYCPGESHPRDARKHLSRDSQDQMPTSLSTLVASDLSLPPGSYIYSLLPAADCLTAISSDNSLRVFDQETLKLKPGGVFENVNQGVTCVKRADHEGNTLATGGRDGAVRYWDLRSGKKITEFKADNNAPILSLDCNQSKGNLAAGTELIHSLAALIMWDIRSPRRPQLQYVESHNDDITELQFHPTDPSLLLSGSTDGLVNIYNTNITDENDALHQIINHGSSIHYAGFLNDIDIFALSHDESLAVYQLANPDESVEEPLPNILGDVRARLGCEYVAEVLKTNGGAVIGAGSHTKHQLDLVSLSRAPEWSFNDDAIVRLPGAHSDDIIRTMNVDEKHNIIYTGGEDGHVRAWKLPEGGQDIGAGVNVKTSGKLKDRPSKEGRFKPY
ncbi:MAG: hypothetical protein M1812_003465 [Candelaria pacifica]|nr:MAG: hypothetical protein M1812_003465 [Candelaria pacifica]